MLANEKVHQLRDTIIEDQFNLFLKKLGIGSENTKKFYERDIREFFSVATNKEIKHLTVEDVQKINLDIVESYQNYLVEKKRNKASTVNRKITALHRFMQHLKKRVKDENDKYIFNIKYFDDVDNLPESDESYDAFEIDEFIEVADWVRENESNGELKYLLMWYSVETGARISECLNLTWDNFIPKKDHVIIRYVAKGKQERDKKIPLNLYNHLLETKSEEKDKVFPFHTTTIQRMMNRIKKQFNIPKARRIVFHSFRKTGATYVHDKTGDIIAARDFLGHKDVSTTQVYLKKRDYGMTGLFSDMESVSEDYYKDLSHEGLLKVIENLNTSQKLLLNVKAKELKEAGEIN